MKSYLLIDSYNMFFRAAHVINEKDKSLRNNMLMNTLFFMIKKACEKFKPDHIVICTDGHGTWRKKVYPQYKATRIEKLQEKTPDEIEKMEEFQNVFENDFLPFLRDKTNVTFLGFQNAEADDIVARFCKLYPNDIKIIVSSDNDYIQLINDNTIIYNSMDDRIITKDCMLSSLNNKAMKFTLKDGKISVQKNDPLVGKGDSFTPMEDWVDYALFMKIIRGDKSDNIFSAYPKVREKSTSKTIGMLDAFEDRKTKGYNWQTFMNSTWETPLGEKKLVKECYEFNKKIIDLNEIPDDIRIPLDEYILQSKNKEPVSNVSIHLMKYLNKWELHRLSEMAGYLSEYLSKKMEN